MPPVKMLGEELPLVGYKISPLLGENLPQYFYDQLWVVVYPTF